MLATYAPLSTYLSINLKRPIKIQLEVQTAAMLASRSAFSGIPEKDLAQLAQYLHLLSRDFLKLKSNSKYSFINRLKTSLLQLNISYEMQRLHLEAREPIEGHNVGLFLHTIFPSDRVGSNGTYGDEWGLK